MKVGILGSGDVAQALGRAFAARGHDVKLGTRDPKKLEAWAGQTRGTVGSFADAARHGEVVFLCTLGSAAEQVLDLAGAANVQGKVLVDVTVPLDFSKGMPPGLFVGTTDSLGERVQRKVPGAKVVKAFCTAPNVRMANPGVPGARLPVAGDDPAAKQRVEAIAKELGWSGVLDLGGLDGARWMEAFVPMWVRACIAQGRWDLVLDFRA